MVIEEIMYQHSLNSPDKIAIISGELRVSYGELYVKSVRRLTGLVLRVGIKTVG